MAIVKVLTKAHYLVWECMGSLGMGLGYRYPYSEAAAAVQSWGGQIFYTA